MKFLIAMLGLVLCSTVAAQGMYKCKDAAGKITYSGKECHLIGLTSAGEVSGRASVTPAVKSSPTGPAYAPAQDRAAPPAKESSAEASAAPERRCFTVKTAKGTATRCNDSPEDDAGSK